MFKKYNVVKVNDILNLAFIYIVVHRLFPNYFFISLYQQPVMLITNITHTTVMICDQLK